MMLFHWKKMVATAMATSLCFSGVSMTAFADSNTEEKTCITAQVAFQAAQMGNEALGLTEVGQIDESFAEWQTPLIGETVGEMVRVSNQPAVVVGSNLVNVRSDAGTAYSQITQLVRYQPVEILGEKTASNGVVWYKIGFTKDGKYTEGYMHSSYIMATTNLPGVGAEDANFEKSIEAFPDSYKVQLRGLHKMFPNWQFEAVLTGLDFEEVIRNEYVLKRNLVPGGTSSAFSWKSVRDGDYNWDTNTWISHDANWIGASREIISYYLDPRNFLTPDSRISQFETLAFVEGVQNKEGLASILKDSFMGNDTYYGYFLNAAKETNVSPYLLASRCLQEVGRNGSSSTSGTYPGYEGYYNFFNIGASANADGSGAVENGLKYAKEHGWNTIQKSISGGAAVIGKNYIMKGQNTFYFQKFNVVNKESGLYSHQYMQNLSAASTEGASLKKTYRDWENAAIVYRIPVYENMPEEAIELPVALTNNYNKLSDVRFNGLSLNDFDCDKFSYEVEMSCGDFTLDATCKMQGTSVECPKSEYLNVGQYDKSIIVKAVDGSTREYKVHISVKSDVKGDTNGDGEVTAEDALYVLKYLAGIINVDEAASGGLDVDVSGDVTAEDALLILKYLAGIIDNF